MTDDRQQEPTSAYDLTYDDMVEMRAQAIGTFAENYKTIESAEVTETEPLTYEFLMDGAREPPFFKGFRSNPMWAVERDGDVVTMTSLVTRRSFEERQERLREFNRQRGRR